MSRSDKALSATTFDCDASTTRRRAHNAHRLILLVVLLHLDYLVAQLNQDLFKLLILVPLLLVLLLEMLLALHALLEFALGHLQINLQNGPFID